MKNKIIGAVNGVINEFNGMPGVIDGVGSVAVELFAMVLISLPEKEWKRCAEHFVSTAKKRAKVLKSSGAVEFI